MNKPITSRVRQATNGNRGVQEPLLDVGAAGVRGGAATRKQPSPLKFGGAFGRPTEETAKVSTPKAAGDIVTTNVASDTKATPKTKVLMNPGGNLGGGNASLISGSANVAGGITRGTDIKTEGPPNSGSKRSGRTIGDAFQDNMVARIDKAGELGRARREARRAGKAGGTESVAPSAEKAARDARVDNIISKNTSSSSLNNTMPAADFSGMGKADAAPSAKSIRQAGRASRKEDRQAFKADKSSERQANKAYNAEKRQDEKSMKQNKRQDKKEGTMQPLATKSKSIGASTGGAKLNMPSLGDRPRTTNASNEDYNDALFAQADAKEDSQLSALDTKYNRNKPMGSESMLNMRMNANVGIKSKSPMKKGYFKGM